MTFFKNRQILSQMLIWPIYFTLEAHLFNTNMFEGVSNQIARRVRVDPHDINICHIYYAAYNMHHDVQVRNNFK